MAWPRFASLRLIANDKRLGVRQLHTKVMVLDSLNASSRLGQGRGLAREP
jgi:hypothetical protein